MWINTGLPCMLLYSTIFYIPLYYIYSFETHDTSYFYAHLIATACMIQCVHDFATISTVLNQYSYIYKPSKILLREDSFYEGKLFTKKGYNHRWILEHLYTYNPQLHFEPKSRPAPDTHK